MKSCTSLLGEPDARRWLRAALAAFALAAVLAFLTLLLGAASYAISVSVEEKLRSCLSNPVLAALNLLPPLLLLTLGLLLTRRLWAAYLFAAVPSFTLALANFYKVALRGDPLAFSDLRLIRTTSGILSRYRLPYNDTVAWAAVCAVLGLAASLCAPRLPRAGRARPAVLLACLAAVPLLLEPCYLSEASYAATENAAYVLEDSDSERYASRGPWYSFLHTVPDVFSALPANYAKRNGERVLSRYRGADIPDRQRVQVVGVMLESFCDLTDYPILAAHEGVAAVYEPLHGLEAGCVSGRLITNIFSGGTVDTEWGFLTGLSHHDEFTAPLDTYVRYFSSQGYETSYLHPGYDWFFDRRAVNQYLGFDRCYFSEDGFGELVDPELAPYRSDAVLFGRLLDELDARGDTDAPLFSFAVTYQNHGPYGSDLFEGAVVTPEETGWSEQACGILSHYLYGVENTIEELLRFTDALERRGEPVVLVVFGDHKPWLGNDKAVYMELGVNMDLGTGTGLRNVYSTPYLIWANRAAKRTLGKPFAGDGGELSPCLLMEELFDRCGWEGPAFMQLARELREKTPLIHVRGTFLVDGMFLSKQELPKELLTFYLDYRDAEVWREKYALA